MTRPNFRIIEHEPNEVDYDEFKKDFLDPYTTVKEIREKYGLGNGGYKEYKSRVLEETGLTKKPSYTYGKLRYLHMTTATGSEYIRKMGKCYHIFKTFGRKTTHHGRYKDYETAKLVRDKLLANNWDDTLSRLLQERYAMKHNSNSHIYKAEKIYEDFKDDYLHNPMKMDDIVRKKYKISNSLYLYLVKMLREDGVTRRDRCHVNN